LDHLNHTSLVPKYTELSKHNTFPNEERLLILSSASRLSQHTSLEVHMYAHSCALSKVMRCRRQTPFQPHASSQPYSLQWAYFTLISDKPASRDPVLRPYSFVSLSTAQGMITQRLPWQKEGDIMCWFRMIT
jgi:hypothetical protein